MAVAVALDPQHFAGELNGRAVGLYTLVAPGGRRVAISNYGARILQILVPDAQGELRDVVLGYDSFDAMVHGLPSMGAFMGRYANRIAKAQLNASGQIWHLPANDGAHCLHGGPAGSRHQVFEVLAHTDAQLLLQWTFLEAQDGFPGDVHLLLRYTLAPDGSLSLDCRASVWRRATVLNFTSHPFFNLEGHAQGDVRQHRVQCDADRYLPVDGEGIPTGELRDVDGSAFDFRSGQSWAEALAQAEPQLALGARVGMDHCLLLPERQAGDTGLRGLRCLARAWAPGSGIGLACWSDAPAIQLYSGAGLPGTRPLCAGKQGQLYGPYAGFCLEPQSCPDAPHHPHFPPVWAAPGATLQRRIVYRFSA